MLPEAGELLDECRRRGLRIATAESCTGGLLASLLTELSGSSAVFERGFVTYSNESKIEMLGVKRAVIDAQGAVSELVALEMAEGAIAHSRADLAVSITGIAGPSGGSDEKPVGLVHFGCAQRGAPTLHDCHVFSGSRAEIRGDAVAHAVRMLKSIV